jgi:hypothetical protein
MKAYLLALIPWTFASFGVCFLAVSFGLDWPDWHFIVAGALLGVAVGTWRLAK